MDRLKSVARIIIIFVFAWICSLATPAAAFVRTTTEDSGVPVSWGERCIGLAIDSRGSQDVPLDQVTATFQRAMGNWTTRTSVCGGLTLSLNPVSEVLEVANDGQPALIFRNQVWQRPGHAPYDPAAIGLTTVMYVSTPGRLGDGTILDADIELNNVNYTFTTDPANANANARGGTTIADLENTLTHELGHVQGLAHTCYDGTTPSRPVDDTGTPIPDCRGVLPLSITEATMYPFALSAGETSKRNLSSDDVSGVCTVYSTAVDQHLACAQTLRGGCSTAPAPGRGERTRARGTLTLAVLVVGALAFALRRRRRQRCG
jgi:hypothetical protein